MNRIIALGGEGLMLRKPKSTYAVPRAACVPLSDLHTLRIAGTRDVGPARCSR